MSDPALLWITAAAAVSATAGGATLAQRLRRDRRRLAALHREKEVVYSFVQDMGEVFNEADSVECAQLLEQVLRYALRTARASAGAIYLRDEKTAALTLGCCSGIFPPPFPGLDEDAFASAASPSDQLDSWLAAHPPQSGLLVEVAEHGRAVLLANAAGDPRIPQYAPDALRMDTFLAVPMRFHRKVIGIVALANRVDGMPFRRNDLDLLQTLADQASVSIHYAGLRDAMEAKRDMDRDMEFALGVQRSLLPKSLPDIPGFELAAFTAPAQKVGGDYYDLLRVDDDHIGIAVADVSGKSVAGAILMATCRMALRSIAPGRLNPAEVLDQLNRTMQDEFAGDRYVTMLYAILEPATGTLRIARAGHESPYFLRAGEEECETLSPPGFAVGLVDAESFSAVIQEQSVSFQPGDTLLLYTDGIPEAEDALRSQWGRDALALAFARIRPAPAGKILDGLREEVLQFAGKASQSDDMTMLVLKALSRDPAHQGASHPEATEPTA